MGLKCGIIGLPNVGKSTLFNALMEKSIAEAANFPFCTIKPNIGRVSVPDNRLYKIAQISQSINICPTHIEFIDIAGLVHGASQGDGLGNQFLSYIRQTDAIIHVLRCFDDSNITHIDGSINPIRDAETIETELMIADMENLEKRLDNKKKIDIITLDLIERALTVLRKGKPTRIMTFNGEKEQKLFRNLQLLTSKPILYVCNVDEESIATGNHFSQDVAKMISNTGNSSIIISAEIESQLNLIKNLKEKKEFLKNFGI